MFIVNSVKCSGKAKKCIFYKQNTERLVKAKKKSNSTTICKLDHKIAVELPS